MNLLYFTSIDMSNPDPGAKAHIENILIGLHALDWDITLFSCASRPDQHPKYPFRNILIKKKNYSLLSQIIEQVKLGNLLVRKKWPADIIYVRFSPLLIAPVIFGILKNIPVCCEINAVTEFSVSFRKLLPVALAIENWILRKSRRIITTSYEIKKHLSNRAGIPREKIAVIPMGYDVRVDNGEYFGRQKERDKANCWIIGYLGQLHQRQGVSTLLRSIQIVARSYDNVQLELAGSGPEEPNIRKLIRELGIEKKVKLLGYLSRGQISAFLERCDITVAPYYGSFEDTPMGSPSKIITYLAAGKPVITSRLSSLQVFGECADVFFFTPDSGEDLAKAIISVIVALEKGEREFGKDGPRFVKDVFSWDNLVTKTDYILQTCLKKR